MNLGWLAIWVCPQLVDFLWLKAEKSQANQNGLITLKVMGPGLKLRAWYINSPAFCCFSKAGIQDNRDNRTTRQWIQLAKRGTKRGFVLGIRLSYNADQNRQQGNLMLNHLLNEWKVTPEPWRGCKFVGLVRKLQIQRGSWEQEIFQMMSGISDRKQD